MHHVYSGTPRYAVREWGWRYLSPVATPTEVEALRRERDDWKRLCTIAEPEVAALRAENARLRDALDELVMACELPGDHCEVAQSLPRARAALAKEPEA
jgi:hypothetical protein